MLGLPADESVYKSVNAIIESSKAKPQYNINNTTDGCVSLFGDTLKIVGKSVLLKPTESKRANPYSTRTLKSKSLELRTPVSENINLIDSDLVDLRPSISDRSNELGQARKVFLAQTRESEYLGFCFQSGPRAPGHPIAWPGRPGHSVTGDLHRMTYIISARTPNDAVSVCAVPEPLESATMLGMRKCSSKDIKKPTVEPSTIFEEVGSGESIAPRESVTLSLATSRTRFIALVSKGGRISTVAVKGESAPFGYRRGCRPLYGSEVMDVRSLRSRLEEAKKTDNKTNRGTELRTEDLVEEKPPEDSKDSTSTNSEDIATQEESQSEASTDGTKEKRRSSKRVSTDGQRNTGMTNKDEIIEVKGLDEGQLERIFLLNEINSRQSKIQSMAQSKVSSPTSSSEEQTESSEETSESENIDPFLITGPVKYHTSKTDDTVTYNGTACQTLLLDFWYLHSFIKFSTFDIPFLYEKTNIDWQFNQKSITRGPPNDPNDLGQSTVASVAPQPIPNTKEEYIWDLGFIDGSYEKNITTPEQRLRHIEMNKRDIALVITANLGLCTNRHQLRAIKVLETFQKLQIPYYRGSVRDMSYVCDSIMSSQQKARQICKTLLDCLQSGRILLTDNFRLPEKTQLSGNGDDKTEEMKYGVTFSPGEQIGQDAQTTKNNNSTVRNVETRGVGGGKEVYNIDGDGDGKEGIYKEELYLKNSDSSLDLLPSSKFSPPSNIKGMKKDSLEPDPRTLGQQVVDSKGGKYYLNSFNPYYYTKRLNPKIISLLSMTPRNSRYYREDAKKEECYRKVFEPKGFGELESYHISDFVITPKAMKLAMGDLLYIWMPYDPRSPSIFQNPPRLTQVRDLRLINFPEIRRVTMAAYGREHVHTLTIVARGITNCVKLLKPQTNVPSLNDRLIGDMMDRSTDLSCRQGRTDEGREKLNGITGCVSPTTSSPHDSSCSAGKQKSNGVIGDATASGIRIPELNAKNYRGWGRFEKMVMEMSGEERSGITMKIGLTESNLQNLLSALPRVLGDLGYPYRDPYGWAIVDMLNGDVVSVPRTKGGEGDSRDPKTVELPKSLLCIELLPTQSTLLNCDKAEGPDDFLINNVPQINQPMTLNRAFSFCDAFPFEADEIPLWSPDETVAVLVSNVMGKTHTTRNQQLGASISNMGLSASVLYSTPPTMIPPLADPRDIGRFTPLDIQRTYINQRDTLGRGFQEYGGEDPRKKSNFVLQPRKLDCLNNRYTNFFGTGHLIEHMTDHYTSSKLNLLINRFPRNEVESVIKELSVGILSGLQIEWPSEEKFVLQHKDKIKGMGNIARRAKEDIQERQNPTLEKITRKKPEGQTVTENTKQVIPQQKTDQDNQVKERHPPLTTTVQEPQQQQRQQPAAASSKTELTNILKHGEDVADAQIGSNTNRTNVIDERGTKQEVMTESKPLSEAPVQPTSPEAMTNDALQIPEGEGATTDDKQKQPKNGTSKPATKQEESSNAEEIDDKVVPTKTDKEDIPESRLANTETPDKPPRKSGKTTTNKNKGNPPKKRKSSRKSEASDEESIGNSEGLYEVEMIMARMPIPKNSSDWYSAPEGYGEMSQFYPTIPAQQFLIKWLNYSYSDATWEPEWHLNYNLACRLAFDDVFPFTNQPKVVVFLNSTGQERKRLKRRLLIATEKYESKQD